MKTAISLPDEVFRKADRLAKRLGKSRSELYREAVTEYLRRREPDIVREEMDRVADKIGVAPEGFLAAAGRRVLEQSEW